MTTVAIIPARGGSKGLPNKNLLPLGGISLIGRAVANALRSNEVTEVIVTSDSEAILREASFWGARTHLRSSKNSSDTATSESALLEVLQDLHEIPETIVFMQATSPFTSTGSISGAISLLEQKPYGSSIIGVVESHKFAWQKLGERIEPIAHSATHRTRRQDLSQKYLETGSFYVFRGSTFMETKSRFCVEVFPYIQNQEEDFEIDSRADFERATQLVSSLPRRAFPNKVDALIVDFDGVLTTNRAQIDEDGKEYVDVNRSDGLWMTRLGDLGIEVLLLSSDRSGLAQRRAEMLGIESITSTDIKAKELRNWANTKGIPLENCIYIGNDINDVPSMSLCGWSACPSDSTSPALKVSDFVTPNQGGKGAVQQICERIEQAMNQRSNQ